MALERNITLEELLSATVIGRAFHMMKGKMLALHCPFSDPKLLFETTGNQMAIGH